METSVTVGVVVLVATIMAIKVCFSSGRNESGGRAVEYVGTDAGSWVEPRVEKRPRHNSGQLVKR